MINIIKNKKSIVILAIIAIVFLLCCITAIVFYYNAANRKEASNDIPITITSVPNQSRFSYEQGRACRDKVGSNLTGMWLYPGGLESDHEYGEIDKDVPAKIYIVLLENGKFITSGWGGDGINPTGTWAYSRGQIAFSFNENTVKWTEKDAAVINDYYEDISYDVATMTLTAPIGFIQRSEDFTGECDLEQFHVNMLNYYLYKEDCTKPEINSINENLSEYFSCKYGVSLQYDNSKVTLDQSGLEDHLGPYLTLSEYEPSTYGEEFEGTLGTDRVTVDGHEYTFTKLLEGEGNDVTVPGCMESYFIEYYYFQLINGTYVIGEKHSSVDCDPITKKQTYSGTSAEDIQRMLAMMRSIKIRY